MKLKFDLGKCPVQTIPIGSCPLESIMSCSPLKWYSVRLGGDAGYIMIIVSFKEGVNTVDLRMKLYNTEYNGFNASMPRYTTVNQDQNIVKLSSKFEKITLLYDTRYYSVIIGSKTLYRTWDVCYSYELTYECEFEYDNEVNTIISALRSPREIIIPSLIVPTNLFNFKRREFTDTPQRSFQITPTKWRVNSIPNDRARKSLERPENTPSTVELDAEVVRLYLVNKISRNSDISVVFTELYKTTQNVNFVVQFWFHRSDGYDELVFSFQDSNGTKRMLVEIWEVNNGVHEHKYDLCNVKLSNDLEVFLVMLRDLTTYIIIDGEVKKFTDFVGRTYEYETFGYEIQLVKRPKRFTGSYTAHFPRWGAEVYLIGDVQLEYSDAANTPRQVGYKQCNPVAFEPGQVLHEQDLLKRVSDTPVVVGEPSSGHAESTPENPPPVVTLPPPKIEEVRVEERVTPTDIEKRCVQELSEAYNMNDADMEDFILASSIQWGTSVEAIHNKYAKALIRVGLKKIEMDHAKLTKAFFKHDATRNLLREFCRRRSGYVARKIQQEVFDVNMHLVAKYTLLKNFAHLAFDFLNMKYFSTATQDELMESNKVVNYKYIRVSKLINYDKY
ncbi:minor coat protein [Agapanthus velarivirus]|nr:minor coat protein [Agapanthus velarivirus]